MAKVTGNVPDAGSTPAVLGALTEWLAHFLFVLSSIFWKMMTRQMMTRLPNVRIIFGEKCVECKCLLKGAK